MERFCKEDIKVISPPSAQNPFAVLYKPAGLPSAPLRADDGDNLCAEAARIFPELKSVRGAYKDFELGLLHRLDTATRGLLVMASTQEAYDALMRAQKEGLFVKEYRALCRRSAVLPEGFPEFGGICGGVIESGFRPYGRGRAQVRPVTQGSCAAAKKKAASALYATRVLSAEEAGGGLVLVRCALTRGFRHQVRCHLAWVGLPIAGDSIYDAQAALSPAEFDFCADALRFPHPITGETAEFRL